MDAFVSHFSVKLNKITNHKQKQNKTKHCARITNTNKNKTKSKNELLLLTLIVLFVNCLASLIAPTTKNWITILVNEK